MRYLVTGHTGFKGAWLTLLLRSRGHEVSGISLEPLEDSLFLRAQMKGELSTHIIQDIRDRDGLAKAIRDVRPEVVVHMAAQPLVLESYKNPVETFDTNVSGTLNVLAACSQVKSIRAVLVVTTDKVYRDDGIGNYTEQSPLGGHDPYSASKAMADLLVQSWMNLSPHFKLGIARAGNVIGLGDVSANRLIPDLNRGLSTGTTVVVRNPYAVRPWQHVLDCLNGYTLFLDKMIGEDKLHLPAVLNFGPRPEAYKSVGELVEVAKRVSPSLAVEYQNSDSTASLKETNFLTLDSSQARLDLEWHDRIGFEQAITWSLEEFALDARPEMDRQLEEFEGLRPKPA